MRLPHEKFFTATQWIFVLLGLILIFGPRSWFPSYYHPFYMGILLIISPVLIYLPALLLNAQSLRKRSLVLKMRSVIAFSLLINNAGELGLFQLYRFGFEYDKFSHFLVSMLFAIMLGESLRTWTRLPFNKIALYTISIMFLAGIIWEVLEATSDFLFNTQVWGIYGRAVFSDTLRDILFDTIGILSGILVLSIPKRISKDIQTYQKY